MLELRQRVAALKEARLLIRELHMHCQAMDRLSQALGYPVRCSKVEIACEWEVALPLELTRDQQLALLREWIAEQLDTSKNR